ncbi:MAG: hypothetical protein MK212_00360 [Saprospiraceae bacterium]|nr:hypothetical protein [Saprospiraceae bacterium]
MSSSTQNYILLFDTIARQKEYDEVKIRRKFRGEKFVKNLPVTKKYLYKLVLDTLTHLYKPENPENKVLDKLRQMGVLWDKGLYKLAKKHLTELKQLVAEHQLVFYQPRVLDWEIKLERNAFAFSSTSPESLDSFMTAYREAGETLCNLIQYRNLSTELLFSSRKVSYTRKLEEQLKNFIDLPEVQDVSYANSFEAIYWFYTIRAFYYALSRNYKASTKEGIKLIRFFEENEIYLQTNSIGYTNAMSNVLFLSCFVNAWDTFDQVYQKIQNYAKNPSIKNPQTPIQLQFTLYKCSLTKHRMEGSFEQGVAVLEETEAFMEEHENFFPLTSKILISYLGAYLHLGNGNFDKSSDYIDAIIDSGPNIFPSIYGVAKIMRLILHYEMDQFLLIPYTARSLYRYLTKKEELFDFEREVLRFLKKISNKPSKKEVQEILIEAEKRLVWFQRVAAPNQREPLDYFDYLSWTRSKIQNKPFAQVVAEKNRDILNQQQ